MYSAIYGKNNIKKNGHTATCTFAIIIDIRIIPIKYLFFFVSKKLSINSIVSTNNINVTNCARAAIKSFNKYIANIVNINEIKLFLLNFVAVIYINTPSTQAKIAVVM